MGVEEHSRNPLVTCRHACDPSPRAGTPSFLVVPRVERRREATLAGRRAAIVSHFETGPPSIRPKFADKLCSFPASLECDTLAEFMENSKYFPVQKID